MPELKSPYVWMPLTLHEVQIFRKLYCPHYAECLLVAARADWQGFTCVGCSQELLAPREPTEKDYTPSANLTSFVLSFAAEDIAYNYSTR